MRSPIQLIKSFFKMDPNQSFSKLFDIYVANALSLIGLNCIDDKWNTSILDAFSIWLRTAPIIAFYIFSWCAAVYATNNQNRVICLISMPILLLTFPKSATFYFKGLKLRDLINEIKAYNSFTSTIYEKTRRELYVGIATIIVKVLLTSYSISCFLAVTIPLIQIEKRILPFALKIPYVSPTDHPGYEFHFLFIVLLVWYNISILMGFDSCFYIFSLFISLRLDVCNYMASNFGDSESFFNGTRTQYLNKMVKLHMETYIFITKCSDIMSNAIFFQGFGTLLIVTIIMYSMMTDPAAIWWIPTLISMLMQFFVYCFFGQMVLTKASETADAFYCSQWYQYTTTNEAKTILFFLTNSQIEKGFSGYGLFKLSYATFTQVCKTSFGYYAFLQNVM